MEGAHSCVGCAQCLPSGEYSMVRGKKRVTTREKSDKHDLSQMINVHINSD